MLPQLVCLSLSCFLCASDLVKDLFCTEDLFCMEDLFCTDDLFCTVLFIINYKVLDTK